MERLEKFQIIFNKPSSTYGAGETVYGYGWVVLKEPVCLQTVCLEALGEARVEWLTSSDIQASDEEIFNFTTVLPVKAEKDIVDDDLILHAGSHYFPFEFKLPSRLPSSFRGKHGRLRYFVRLTLYPTSGPSHEKIGKFGVISQLDLNVEPDAALPVESEIFETIGSLCCLAGTVTARLKLERKGYLLQEAIPIMAEIKNLSTRRILDTQVSLVQNVTYYSYRGRFSETSVLVTVHKGAISPGGKQTWQKELLSIPSVPPSHLRGCKIIDLQYSLEMSIRPAGLARKIKVVVDLIIGTVGLRDCTAAEQHVSYHPLPCPPSPTDSTSTSFPLFYDSNSDQVFLTEKSLIPRNMLPTAPPWEENDDIP